MKYFILLFLLVNFFVSSANDGAFTFRGNHLVPIKESSISVDKEILSIRRIGHNRVSVNVYYEFFNPSETKELKVGFEAVGPAGDVNGFPVDRRHPYMYNFSVNMNNLLLNYKTIYTNKDYDLAKGEPIPVDLETLKENYPDGYIQDASVDYIYLFQANFKKGKNVIKNSYEVESYYQFDYVLTAAKRWAGGKIKDFQLIIDMGEFQDFTIENTFFTSLDQWNIVGSGISKTTKNLVGKECSEFLVRSGILEFHQLNFDPKGEIIIDSPKRLYTGEETNRLLHLSFSPEEFQYLPEAETDFEKKIYKNLPFAIRGYVFKNPELQKVYESQSWYFKDPNFHGIIDVLPQVEQEWVKKYLE
jgi:hypothetical protein